MSTRWFIRSIILLCSGFILLISGCGGGVTKNIITDPEGLKIITMDSAFVFQSDRMQQISVRVHPSELARDRTMLCIIRSERGGLIHFRLYDDGNFGDWNDSEGFAHTKSGDAAPNDAIFSRRINSRFAVVTGISVFTFALSGLPPPDSLKVNVVVRENTQPVIIAFNAPDSVLSGSTADEFTVEVRDPDGADDISIAELLIFDPQNEFRWKSFLMENADDTTWNWTSTPGLAARFPSGTYQAAARVCDFLMAVGNEWVDSDTSTVWLENLAPWVDGFEGEYTIWVPQNDDTVVPFDFTVNVADEQGVTDLDSLLLKLFKDTTIAGVDTTILKLQTSYYDGAGLDSVAHDGKYRAGFRADSSNTVPASFVFEWTPTDKGGNTGETFKSYLVLMPAANAVSRFENAEEKISRHADNSFYKHLK